MPCPHKPACAPPAQADGIGCRPQRRPGEHEVSSQGLEQVGLPRRDAEMAQLHLRLGPGEHRGAVERRGAAVLVDGAHERLARGRGHRPERDAHGGPRCPRSHWQRRENTASSTVPTVLDKVPPSMAAASRTPRAAAAQEPGAGRFPRLDAAPRRAAGHQQMRGPDSSGSRRCAPPPCGQDGAAIAGSIALAFGLHEHLGKGGVGDVVGRPASAPARHRT